MVQAGKCKKKKYHAKKKVSKFLSCIFICLLNFKREWSKLRFSIYFYIYFLFFKILLFFFLIFLIN